ncbi:hypothetical protein CC78DRAFT_575476 [Lojkania enalia]|uniref:C2H2-type domain-containing protein n=1 Tax=Lojkania enalia TaxID=147567 RepID=A0A9P4N7D7_9PLEO|nr:hypothetical protein CC78DRAFT_575476 [Didymosphaeria enalia]
MEAEAWLDGQYKQASLPKLRMKEEISRRDSITSSRTGDSGYISDPDISLSPLEFVGRDKVFDIPQGPISYSSIPATFEPSQAIEGELRLCAKVSTASQVAHHSKLLKKFRDYEKALFPRSQITSNPGLGPSVDTAQKANCTRAFKCPVSKGNRNEGKNGAGLSRKEDVELWIDESMPANNRPKERVSSIVSLSSTGSCSNYTNTDDSDMEDYPEPVSSLTSRATIKTIELIMRQIEVNLRYAAYMQCAGGQSSRHQSNASESYWPSRGNSQSSGGKRKLRTEEEDPSEYPEDDGSNKRRRVSITATEESDAGPRFACPFFKHDSNRYRNRRTCPGPGWPTVHRMKEHLYRSHAQPIFCPRCYSMFDSDGDLSNHLRHHPCEISAPQPIDGIDRETLKLLRKRSPALRLEEDKWRDTYKLLFPDVPETDIPSPYYETDSPTEESRRFRRELLARIQHELFTTAEQASGPVEQNMLRQVAGIIQRCENELLDEFYQTTLRMQQQASISTPNPAPNFPPPSRLSSTRHSSQTNIAPLSSKTPLNASGRPEHSIPLPGHSPVTMPSYFSDPPAQPLEEFGWEELQAPSSDWIDWNAVFPPTPGMQIERSEPAPLLSTPVWS